ncbi:AfsR/SARP family transcriptional regulator [Kribbella sp. DT2]|uniref:AfsR/SARP family transcriptional regulator n=1 Tax=Kribbella sp. DT2 TaxID=3393427 RepID=UPI003CF8D19E
MSDGVRFDLLGPLRAWRGDEELELRSHLQRSVLAVLLLGKRRQVSTDEIIAAVWGAGAPRSALMATRSYVSRLRLLLDGIEIRATGGGYQLIVDPAMVDVSVFRKTRAAARAARERRDLTEAARLLDAALALWKGPALQGLTGPFFDSRRTWLEEQRSIAQQDSWSLAIELGRHDEAIADLTEATAANPYHERLWELLMLALTHAGRRDDALAAYDRITRILDQDLGLEPGPGLRKTRASIASPLTHRSVA